MRLLLIGVLLLAGSVHAQDGISVEESSAMLKVVPAEQLEQQANKQYAQLLKEAAAKDALAPDSNPQLKRLRVIAKRLMPYTERFNPRAAQWQWEINLIGSKQINAFCMPGGKIAFYTGILDTLKLSDDEVAMVMGHEVAHALREHAREQASQNVWLGGAANLLGMVFSGSQYGDLANLGISAAHGLASRAFSRSDESEADLIGMDLAARAGYDPRSGITLWQKMAKANEGAPPEWLSTHPSNDRRIEEIRRNLPQVMPLYERAQAERK